MRRLEARPYSAAMGRASKARAAAQAAKRGRADLLDLLAEDIGFLNASAAAYDAGYEAEAKRLAVVLRTLLHDTSQSHSLLQQLQVKNALKWVDTALPLNPGNLMGSMGLVMLQVTVGQGESTFQLPYRALTTWSPIASGVPSISRPGGTTQSCSCRTNRLGAGGSSS